MSKHEAESTAGESHPLEPVTYRIEELQPKRPITPALTRALRIHRSLVLYFTQPLCKEPNGRRTSGRHGFESCGGLDGSAEKPAGEILQHETCLLDYLDRLDRLGRPLDHLSTWHGSEPVPPEIPDNVRINVGWRLHPIGEEPLAVNGAQIRLLVDVLLQAEPDETMRAMLDLISHLGESRRGTPIGWAGVEVFRWQYPHEISRGVEQMDEVLTFEQQMTMAGWKPLWPNDGDRAPSREHGEPAPAMSTPMSKTECARRYLNNPSARTRDFDDYVMSACRVEQVSKYKWSIDLSTLDEATRRRVEEPLR
ncbi:hypothetical protein ACERK3_03825 [Phycisphaerales bacterium AB-hyl4]|uniref:Uncharacterized protein n=1 Tax=Natronomicrosphaera hydrolytica TaxID=3242702 RepID=A0ABV4U3J9_9BACT